MSAIFSLSPPFTLKSDKFDIFDSLPLSRACYSIRNA